MLQPTHLHLLKCSRLFGSMRANRLFGSGMPRRNLLHGLLFASALGLLTACIDTSYNVSDVDLTMGIGSDGLKVKVGNTEKIYLSDIIETDSKTKVDANNMFYFVESGNTEISYRVQQVESKVRNDAQVNPTFHVLRWSDELFEQLHIPAGTTEVTIPAGFTLYGSAEGEDQAKFSTENIGDEVVRLTRVYPKDFSASLIVSMKSSANVNFQLDKLEEFTIVLPSYIHLREVPRGWTLSGNTLKHQAPINFSSSQQEICTISIDYLDLMDQGTPKNGEISLPKSMTRVAMNGTAYFSSKNAFTMRNGDYADIVLDLNFPNDGKVTVDRICGIFDPKIEPEIEPISMVNNLPEFLRGEDTKIKVTNPTLKFNVDMNTLPANVDFTATLTAMKRGKQGWSQEVTLPQTRLYGQHTNTVYYHQKSDKPYDPESAIPADATIKQTSDLSKLVERLPEEIMVDMKDGKVKLVQEETTLTAGQEFRANAEYNMYVPLEVEEGFSIVYRDSTESLEDDLEDYSAEGIELKTVAENTIPLTLTFEIQAVNEMGRPIPGITFTTAKIKAGEGEAKAPVQTEITMQATLNNPKDLRKIDHFIFIVKGENNDHNRVLPLTSKQYVQLTDIRLRLKGHVTVDLNDK